MLNTSIAGKSVVLFPSASAVPLVIVNGEGNEGTRIWEAVRELTAAELSLAVIGGLDWEDELTPWASPAAFKGGTPFGGHADDYLKALTGEVLPGIVAALPQPPAYAALAGYSLAGLFALYAPYKTDAFARAASASGSLWYPGWMDFVQAHRWIRTPQRVYLSVGDREGHTRNPAMRPVVENTRKVAALYEEQGVSTRFELNPGGHFNEPDRRLARAIAWMIAD